MSRIDLLDSLSPIIFFERQRHPGAPDSFEDKPSFLISSWTSCIRKFTLPAVSQRVTFPLTTALIGLSFRCLSPWRAAGLDAHRERESHASLICDGGVENSPLSALGRRQWPADWGQPGFLMADKSPGLGRSTLPVALSSAITPKTHRLGAIHFLAQAGAWACARKAEGAA